jgi:hypothetical protein
MTTTHVLLSDAQTLDVTILRGTQPIMHESTEAGLSSPYLLEYLQLNVTFKSHLRGLRPVE